MIKKLFLILICICLFTGNVAAASDEINSLDVEVEVDSSGTCHVKLTIQAQFASTAKEFLVPLGTDAYDIHASGEFDTESRGDVEYAVFENSFGFTGSQSFSCSYSLPCTMTEDEAGQYFSLQIPEQGFTLPIKRYQITVRFPVEVTELPTWKSAYYQEVIDNYLKIQVTDNVVTASSNLVFKDHETLTMKLRFQPESFDLRHLPGRTSGFAVWGFFLLLVLCVGYWFFRLRSREILLQVHPLQAVNLDSGAGEIPCQLYGMSPDIASLLAHWGNLGYVVIRKNRRGQLYIEKTMDMGNERKLSEQRLFQALFSPSDICEIPSGRFLRAVKREGELIRRSWMQRMFRPTSGNPRFLRLLALLSGVFVNILCFDLLLSAKPSRWFWMVVLNLLGILLCYLAQQVVYAFNRRDGILRMLLGGVATVILLILAWNAECSLYMILNLCLQFLCAYVTRFGGRRSKAGEELLKEILGLRRFLRKANRDVVHQLLSTDSQYFYRMLPYAEMMGFGSTFVRRFGDGGSEPCRWLVSERRKPRTALEFYTLYCEIMTELRDGQRMAQKGSLLAKPTRSNTRQGPGPANRKPRREHTTSRNDVNRSRGNRNDGNRGNGTRRRADTNRRRTESNRRPTAKRP